MKCIEKMHADMRAVYGILTPILEVSELKEAKKMDIGPLTVAYRQDFPPKGKTLLSKPHPQECICPKCTAKTGVVSTVRRIGDSERDACLALLQERHVSGHITLEEFESRKDKALAARTQPELDYLTQDLPRIPEKTVRPEPPPGRGAAVVVWVANVVMIAFPLMSAITVSFHGSPAAAIALAIIAAVAGVLVTVLRDVRS